MSGKSFADLGLSAQTVAVVERLGYKAPTPIQELAIPPLLAGRDVIGQAQTGTGKTAAFGLPLVEYVDPANHDVQALVLTPTRELCIQVTQALRAYGAAKGLRVVALFGGAPLRVQALQLSNGAAAVVGTVGRVVDMLSRGLLILHDARYVVLDEADEMLDLGFLEDVELILRATPNGRQSALFSATIPPAIERLAQRYLYEPQIVRVPAPTPTIETVEQFKVELATEQKEAKLLELLYAEQPRQAIIFVRTKLRCERLYRALRKRGMPVRALHGDMSQGARDGVMIAFKEGGLPLLVATDVAARGLDISTVTHVINFDVPLTPDIYVHRIGRTGRIGREGRAITLVEPAQRRQFAAIERHVGLPIDGWRAGAHSAPGQIKERPRRHRKPVLEAQPEQRTVRLLLRGGRQQGINEAALLSLVRERTGLAGEALQELVVLARYSLLSVPASRVAEVVAALAGARLGRAQLEAQPLGLPVLTEELAPTPA